MGVEKHEPLMNLEQLSGEYRKQDSLDDEFGFGGI